MTSKHIFLETCQLILYFIHLTNTKAVSQNAANFKSLVYMPDQVALELRQLQNGYSALGYQQANYGPYTNYFTKSEGDGGPMEKSKLRAGLRQDIQHTGEREADTELKTGEDAKKRYAIKDVVIDFDELVNKVKDKLKDEFNEKKKHIKQQNVNREFKNDLRNIPVVDTGKKDISLSLKNINKSNIDQVNDNNEPREAWKHFMTSNTRKSEDVAPETQPRVRRPMKKMKKKEKDNANNDLFEIADLTKVKDSYEDYITPKRTHIYASDTESETENPLPKNEGEPKESYKEIEEMNPKESSNENGDQQFKNKNLPKAAEMLKAVRTSDKLRKIRKLDDPINFVPEEYDPNETEKPVEHFEKAMFVKLGDDSDDERVTLKGTMIPTRHFFKMSSPNYFAKWPAVAEKYDFNEPLPDKDREPEKLKYFLNPPASINKKVKLQPNSDIDEENK